MTEPVRKGISAAAARPGGTAAKLERRSEGLDSLGVGTVEIIPVQRGTAPQRPAPHTYRVSPPKMAGWSYRLDERSREEVRAVFVPPDDFEDTVAFARQHPLVVVRVPTGHGKHVTGFRLLDRTGAEELHCLSHPRDLRRLTRERLGLGDGYLLVGGGANLARLLDRHEIARLDTELRHARARLVVVVDTDLGITDGGLGEHLTEIHGRPRAETVVHRHLRWRMAATPKAAEALLARQDVAALIEQETSPDSSPRRAAVLAGLLADSAREPDCAVDSVRTKLSQQAIGELGTWFAGLPDQRARSLAIALAVLNGLPSDTVAEVGRLLNRKLGAPHGPVGGTVLTGLRARTGKATVRTDQGLTPVEVVEYSEPAYPNLVLRHVWQEHPEAHWEIVDWLHDLGGHPIEEVRVRAGTAAGALTAVDFDYLQQQVLLPWGCSKDARHREAAAIALDASHAAPSTRAAVCDLVERWSYADTAEQVATAVRAYGGGVGADRGDAAFQAFDRLAECGDPAVVEAICASLTELVEAGTGKLAGRVLATLAQWTASPSAARSGTGTLAFLLMAADLVWAPQELPATRWPLLLRLAEPERHRAVITELWRTVLDSPEHACLSTQVLDGWAHLAERDELARRAFAALLREAATTPRAEERVRAQAQRWSQEQDTVHAPLTAQAVLAATELV